ncbi:MAG: glycosyltransferase family 4 protein [Chloroflexi bacterium]|nr:glycosyltransferase family 4 protein [Chloroflexota bacterium]
MRIVHFIDYFQPKLGYQEFYLAREHQRLGHDVVVVTSDRYRPFADYDRTVRTVLGDRRVGVGRFQEEGLEVVRLPVLVEHRGSAVPILPGVGRALADLRPELVICHGVFSVDVWLVARTKARLGCPMIFDNHASDYNSNLTDTLPKRTYHLFFRSVIRPAVLRAADAVVAVAESEQTLVCRELGLSPGQVPIIRLGADAEVFRPDPAVRRSVRARLAVGEEDVLLIHAGKLTPNKDVHVLMAAAGRLLRERRGVRLLIVGGGSAAYLGELQRQATAAGVADRVHFHPFVENRELAGLFQAADVGVWPGNLSQAMFEAMATGLPLVLTDRVSAEADTRFLLADDNGLSFPRGDALALQAALDRLVADETTRRLMGRRSRELAERAFSWTAIARQFLALAEGRSRQRGGEPQSRPVEHYSDTDG